MDLGNIPLFKAMMSRMSWLTERQQVLAQNVANVDTPAFKAKDLKAQTFKEMLAGTGSNHLTLASTQPNHLPGVGAPLPFVPVADRNAETSPSGNSVSIEDQMLKVSSTANEYQLTTSLYRRQIGMLKTVLGRTA